MSELFRNVKNQFKNRLPFVVYCKPNSDKTIAFFQKNDTLYEIKDNSNAGFAFVSFDNLQRFLIPENESDIYFEKNLEDAYFFNASEKKSTKVDKNEKLDFEYLIQQGINAIVNKDFTKVVLSRKESVEIDNLNLQLIFNKLVFNYKSGFKSIFYHPKVGLWIGATPEQLLQVDSLKIKTVSLAGTQVFNENNAVIWHNKEKEEQQIVTDYVTKILEKVSNKVSVSEPYTFKAGTIVHLKTDLEAEISSDFKVNNLINLLHPTPAVCGFPIEKAKHFITENENYSREFYSGYIGEWQKNFENYRENSSDLYVNLRCMKIVNNQAHLFVGCGITKDSDPEKEFFETQHKMQTMLAIL